MEQILVKKQATCLVSTRLNLGFKVTAMTASENTVYFATDDKSIRLKKLSDIFTEQHEID